MRGYFTSYAGNLYQVLDYEPAIKQLIQSMNTSLEVSGYPDRHEYSVNIAIDEPPAKNPSNAEMVTSAIEKIEEEKIEGLEKLVPVYRMYMDYTLYDANTSENVDSGTMVKDVNPIHGMIPLGLTDENELVSRFGMSLRTVFEKRYQSNLPYGVQRRFKPRYVFAITRIVLMQLKASAFSVVPTPPKGPGFKEGFIPLHHIPQRPGMGRPKPCDDRWPSPNVHRPAKPHPHPGDYGFGTHHDSCFMGHPTIQEAPTVWSKNNSVVIFDSEEEGITFNQVQIYDDVRNIRIKVYMNLSNFFITSDPADILSHVEENKGSNLPGGDATDDPIIVAPGGDVPEPPPTIPVTPPDNNDKDDTENPDNSGENPGGTTGDGENENENTDNESGTEVGNNKETEGTGSTGEDTSEPTE